MIASRPKGGPNLAAVQDMINSAVAAAIIRFLPDIEARITVAQPFTRAVIKAAGSSSNYVKLARNGEAVADGGNYPVYTAYTSAVYGTTGGPQAGDEVVIGSVGGGPEGVLYKVNR